MSQIGYWLLLIFLLIHPYLCYCQSTLYWEYLKYLGFYPSADLKSNGLIPFSRRSLDTDAQCGQRSRLFFKIVGGTRAPKGAWPWLVALGYHDSGFIPSFECGGSLIATQIVLTAAHCVHQRPDLYMVRLGENVLTNRLGVDLDIAESIVHGAYNPDSNENDIALLKLKDSPKLSNLIRTICLPSENITISNIQRGWIAGWGAKFYDGPASPDLMQLNLELFNNSVCVKAYEMFGKSARIDDRVICAGVASTAGKDACQGDSGGPLMWEDDAGNFHVVGIISFGYKCAEPNFPGVFTSVMAHLPWIQKQLLLLGSH